MSLLFSAGDIFFFVLVFLSLASPSVLVVQRGTYSLYNGPTMLPDVGNLKAILAPWRIPFEKSPTLS